MDEKLFTRGWVFCETTREAEPERTDGRCSYCGSLDHGTAAASLVDRARPKLATNAQQYTLNIDQHGGPYLVPIDPADATICESCE